MIDARQHVIGKMIPFTDEAITVADTSIGLTSSKLTSDPKPKMAIVTVETARIRYRLEGSAPTTTVGHRVGANTSFVLEGFSQMNNFRAIRTTSTSAKLFVTYLR